MTDVEAFRQATAVLASRGISLARTIAEYGLVNPESRRYMPELVPTYDLLVQAQAGYEAAWAPIWDAQLADQAEAWLSVREAFDPAPEDLADNSIAAIRAEGGQS